MKKISSCLFSLAILVLTVFVFSVDAKAASPTVTPTPSGSPSAMTSQDPLYASNYSFTASVMDVIRGLFGLKRVSDVPDQTSRINLNNNRNNIEKANVNVSTNANNSSQRPSIPTNLRAVAISANQIRLTWNHPWSDVPNSAFGYEIYRNGTKLSVKTSHKYYVDTGLSPNTEYSYYIVAYNGNELRSNPSASVTEWTKLSSPNVVDRQEPFLPTNVRATALSSSQIKITWTASTDDVGVVGYKVYRDGVEIGNTTNTSYTDSGLQPGKDYYYFIRAYDAKGNYSNASAYVTEWTNYANSGTAGTDTQPPSIPTNLRVTPVSSNRMNLSWEASTDNVGVSMYQIYRNGSLLFQVNALNTTDWSTTNPLSPNREYTYYVKACDSAGNCSNPSASVTEWTLSNTTNTTNTTPTTDTQPPSIPSNLTATPLSTNQIRLNWSASTDNVGVDFYRVYRDGIHRMTVYSPGFLDTGLQSGKEYTYKIRACDKVGNCSNDSASVTEWAQ